MSTAVGSAADSWPVSRALDGADELRDVERRRLQSLVDGDLEVADALHADDYERRRGRWQAVWSHATRIKS